MADKENLREQRAQEREDIKAIQAGFHMNLDDAFSKVLRKASGMPDEAAGGRDMFTDRDAHNRGGKVTGPENHHIDWESSFLSKLNPRRFAGRSSAPTRYAADNTISIALANRAMEKFHPVMEELGRFKFAAAEAKRDSQMAEIVAAVRETVHKMAVREVVSNTRAFYENATKFFQTEKGVKVIYKVANLNVTLVAEGKFGGDEIICLEQDGTNVTGYVVRNVDDNFEDISGGYTIKLDIGK